MAIAQRVWAFVHQNEVKNTIVCDTYPVADMLAKTALGNEAFAIEITQIPTSIGHQYENGVFKDLNGNTINPLPTAEQEVVSLRAENKLLQSALTEMTTYAASQDERINLQEQALLELTTTIAGGNA